MSKKRKIILCTEMKPVGSYHWHSNELVIILECLGKNRHDSWKLKIRRASKEEKRIFSDTRFIEKIMEN